MPSWSRPSKWGKSIDQQRRDRDQRHRDAVAEASGEYLADIAGDGDYDSDAERE
ncbi:MAG: hypothetical protein ACKOB8_04435 [Mycobacterium sp.]